MSAITTPQLLKERFWDKVHKTKKCWIWRGATRVSPGQKRNRGNYGIIRIQGKIYNAARISWELKNGKIPFQLCVLHKCDNPPCIRPSHLWLGTIYDNNKDKAKKGRAWQPIGEKAPWSKLTEKEILKIRSLYKSGKFTHNQLGEKFGIKRASIGLIVNRINWKHIP